jgi:KUP system potassium uptake protein
LPRLTVIHTSRSELGQIYIPEVNALLAVACLAVVLGFRSSSALSAAYGIAVTGTMVMTTLLFYRVTRSRWRWPRSRSLAVTGLFLVIELVFLGATLLKIVHGGWVPIVIAASLFLVMTTWRRGTFVLARMLTRRSVPLERFLAEIQQHPPVRVSGTGVFLTAHTSGTPEVLVHHLRHNKALHEQIIFLSVVVADIPEVPEDERVSVEPHSLGFYRVTARYGFMETPNVAAVVARCCRELPSAETDVTYYLGRPTLIATGPTPMMKWRKLLFTFLARNARPATQFFAIPANQVVELGMHVEF